MSSEENVTERGIPTTSDVYRTTWIDYDYPSTAVVDAVAEATGRDQMDLERLQAYVDGDALDALLTEGTASDVSVTFTYGDVEVRVTARGDVDVRRYH